MLYHIRAAVGGTQGQKGRTLTSFSGINLLGPLPRGLGILTPKSCKTNKKGSGSIGSVTPADRNHVIGSQKVPSVNATSHEFRNETESGTPTASAVQELCCLLSRHVQPVPGMNDGHLPFHPVIRVKQSRSKFFFFFLFYFRKQADTKGCSSSFCLQPIMRHFPPPPEPLPNDQVSLVNLLFFSLTFLLSRSQWEHIFNRLVIDKGLFSTFSGGASACLISNLRRFQTN